MPSSSTERHDHRDSAHQSPAGGPTASSSAIAATHEGHRHHHGQHVMPDGTVMDGARHEHVDRGGPPLWWERGLFWLCWALLAMLGIWIAAAALAPRQ